jgi:putative phosphoribosyl transferase
MAQQGQGAHGVHITDHGNGYQSEVFRDRLEAGDRLGEALVRLALNDPVVLGLARGGVEIASRLAWRLDAALEVLVVRKIGHPQQPELGIGALSEGGVVIVDERAAHMLGVSTSELERVELAERQELERRVRAYRRGRPMIDLVDRTAVLVDDGIATGVTMRAAVATARAAGATRVVVAAPVGAAEIVESLRALAEVFCVETPNDLSAVGAWYESFPQLSDEDVLRCLDG